MTATDLPLVFVTVGTDHHPFDRLMAWVDRWLEAGPPGPVRCLVQTGTSRPPRRAVHRDYISYQEMETNLSEASAVVCHGGPGTVMMCRWAGRIPIVVPRRHDLGEHVDDHQVLFAKRLASEGELRLAEDEAAFRASLERALRGDGVVDLRPEHRAMDAVARFESLVGGLLGTRMRDAPPAPAQVRQEGTGRAATS